MTPDEGSKLLVLIPFLFITFSLVLILLEAWILQYFIQYKTFLTALGNALIVNIASTLVGFFIIDWINQSISRILVLWVITVIIETILLVMLNKKVEKKEAGGSYHNDERGFLPPPLWINPVDKYSVILKHPELDSGSG